MKDNKNSSPLTSYDYVYLFLSLFRIRSKLDIQTVSVSSIFFFVGSTASPASAIERLKNNCNTSAELHRPGGFFLRQRFSMLTSTFPTWKKMKLQQVR